MRKILLVQRDKKLEEQLSSSAIVEDYEIVSVGSVRESKSLLDSDSNIDLVIADLRLGDGSGLELLHYSRSRTRLSFIPIIITSASYSRQEVIRCGELGAAALINLPISIEQLQTKIANVVRDGKRTVLVVDDDAVILDILCNMLELERFRVITASSGPEAIEAVTHETVHAVVSDVLMPDTNGIDLLKRIKKERPALPVILVTGYSGKYSPRQAASCGADGFLTKPFRNVELVKLLHDTISQADQRRSRQVPPSSDKTPEQVSQS